MFCTEKLSIVVEDVVECTHSTKRDIECVHSLKQGVECIHSMATSRRMYTFYSTNCRMYTFYNSPIECIHSTSLAIECIHSMTFNILYNIYNAHHLSNLISLRRIQPHVIQAYRQLEPLCPPASGTVGWTEAACNEELSRHFYT